MCQLFLAAMLLTLSNNATAYLDPGTGSLILQGLIAGLAMVGMTVKNYWYKISAWFGKEDRHRNLLDDEDADNKSDA